MVYVLARKDAEDGDRKQRDLQSWLRQQVLPASSASVPECLSNSIGIEDRIQVRLVVSLQRLSTTFPGVLWASSVLGVSFPREV